MADWWRSKTKNSITDCGNGLRPFQFNEQTPKKSPKSVKIQDDFIAKEEVPNNNLEIIKQHDNRTNLCELDSSSFKHELETPAQSFVWNESMKNPFSNLLKNEIETVLPKSIQHLELNEKYSSANRETLEANPFQSVNSAVTTESSTSNQIWFYRDSNFRTHGPFTSIEMAMWDLSGYFDESLIVKRACDSQYTTLGELIKISENKLPFLASHLIPPLRTTPPNNVVEKTVDKTPKVMQTAGSSFNLSLFQHNLKQLQVKCLVNEEKVANDKIQLFSQDKKKTSFKIKTKKLPNPLDQFLESETDEDTAPEKSTTKFVNRSKVINPNQNLTTESKNSKICHEGSCCCFDLHDHRTSESTTIPFNFGYSNALQASCEKSIHKLTTAQAARLEDTKTLFSSFKIGSLGVTNLESHVIDVRNFAPVRCPVSSVVDAIVYSELDKMLQCGVIKESSSPWNSTVVVMYEEGYSTICLDWRRLNAATKGDIYAMPQKNLVLEKLKTAKYISCIDLKAIYWQIPLDQRSQELTAFKIAGRPAYQFTRMPSGLKNARQRMCRLLDKVLPTELREFTSLYLDYLLVFSKEFNVHIELLRRIASCFNRANLTVNIEKSRFCLSGITYFGYIVGNGTFMVDCANQGSITHASCPQLRKTLEDFNAMTSWYRRFINDYDKLMEPLNRAEQMSIKSNLPPNAQDAFVQIKRILKDLIVEPNFKNNFFIQCNASRAYVNGILYQIDNNGIERPVAYHLKKLSGLQSTYSIVELECLAVVSSLRQFRPFIEGTPFRIFTDRSILMCIMNHPELNNRLARWCIELQAFDFVIETRKDNRNGQPMRLTRVDASQKSRIEYSLRNFNHFTDYEKLKKKINGFADPYPDYKIVDNLIYMRCFFSTGYPELDKSAWKLWIPAQLASSILLEAHIPPFGPHMNTTDLVDFLQIEYYWPSMHDQANQLVNNCKICNKNNNKTKRKTRI